MPKVITDGKTKIGAFMFSDRKKPCLCIAKGNIIVSYGSLHDEERAEEFMNELCKFFGVVIEEREIK